MVRDIYKDDQYFRNYLDSQEKRIEKFTGVLAQLSEKDIIAKRERYLADYYRDALTASYSAGKSRAEVKQCFMLYYGALEKSGISDYVELIDVLSLMILFEIREVDLNKIVINEKYEDALVAILESYIDKSEEPLETKIGDLLYPEFYAPFYQYLCDKISEKEFVSYIEHEWYSSSKDLYWYDSHKNPENIYVGYWCWLAAASLKIKSAQLSTGKYIPLDMI